MSSAQAGAWTRMSPILAPIPVSCIRARESLLLTFYKSALSTPPWRTPCSLTNDSEVSPHHFTDVTDFSCRLLMTSHSVGSTPALYNFLMRFGCTTTSKADLASMNAI